MVESVGRTVPAGRHSRDLSLHTILGGYIQSEQSFWNWKGLPATATVTG